MVIIGYIFQYYWILPCEVQFFDRYHGFIPATTNTIYAHHTHHTQNIHTQSHIHTHTSTSTIHFDINYNVKFQVWQISKNAKLASYCFTMQCAGRTAWVLDENTHTHKHKHTQTHTHIHTYKNKHAYKHTHPYLHASL